MTSNNNIHALVQRATEPNNEFEDWEAFLQISDLLVQRPDETCDNVCSQIFKAMSAPHPRTRFFSVALLDSCVKNSNKYFEQSLLRHPKTVHLNSTLKNDSDTYVVEKWDEVSEEWKKNYPVLYDTAMGKAVVTSSSSSFAAANLPPPPSTATTTTATATTARRRGEDIYNNNSEDRSNLERKKKERILNDLQVVEDNCALMSSFIEHAESGQSLRNDEAVQQIHANMQEMNRRLMVLIERVPDEELLMKALEAHELLFATLDNYKHYLSTGEKRKTHRVTPQDSSSPKAATNASQTTTTSQNLLDDIDLFFDTPPVVNKGKSPMSTTHANSVSRVESMSLDDFLSQPAATSSVSSSSNPAYDPFQMDSMESELSRINQERQSTSSSGFAALARRKTQSHVSPNPFVISPEAEPNPFVEEQTIPQPKLFTPRGGNSNTDVLYPSVANDSSAPPLQEEDTTDGGSGFAALARRNKNKKVSPMGEVPPQTGDFFLE